MRILILSLSSIAASERCNHSFSCLLRCSPISQQEFANTYRFCCLFASAPATYLYIPTLSRAGLACLSPLRPRIYLSRRSLVQVRTHDF
ncbi:uncharacterized protein LOC118754903 isoform X2 [Rhagoletis pomonella]|uniref:uncharacterized protein LOC118735512 isoform X2 n=1 Tax=Rhagoletis pomonella TaxID=28610 RepID=UPI001780FD7D|nr:uncharacterized protein LOC118735512 isoform X2 [Rhagoletis pomonella]XP_036325487.1 uncharacterized protein LOC118738682 isoform X2 [Rhagoletis pomonella]XP_036345669.1 uncharacterized protein LOC118754903 isoform X2 [Rhagoletis pomonella]